MTRLRMDHVVIVVEDLEPAIAFFAELGLEMEGRAPIAGEWVDRINDIPGVQVEIAMMRTPDGHNKVELTKFHAPALIDTEPKVAPPNTLGLRSIMFEVDDIDDMVARLATRGGKLIGEIVAYEDIYRLCYMRGPGSAIIALAESLRR